MPPTRTGWYHNIWFVLCMLLFVAGPFGLPLVWSNPRFSRGMKAVLTILMGVYTAVLVWGVVVIIRAAGRELDQLNAAFAS